MTLDDARAIHWRRAGLLDAAYIIAESANSIVETADPIEVCQTLAKKIEAQAESIKALIPPRLHEQLMEALKDEFGQKRQT